MLLLFIVILERAPVSLVRQTCRYKAVLPLCLPRERVN